MRLNYLIRFLVYLCPFQLIIILTFPKYNNYKIIIFPLFIPFIIIIYYLLYLLNKLFIIDGAKSESTVNNLDGGSTVNKITGT